MSAYPPLASYAVIGDCRSAALISSAGSLDWLCVPQFHSDAVFAALLDEKRGGRFRVAPAGEFSASRRYVPDTNVLETTFRTPTGCLQLIDLMPVADEEGKNREIWPEHEILRQARCLEGTVDIEVQYEPRWEYGCRAARLESHPHDTVQASDGPRIMVLHSDVPLTITTDGSAAAGRSTLRAGDCARFGWSFAFREIAVMPARGTHADRLVEQSIRWWRDWTHQISYDGPYREAVVRSALVLKLLTYAPSGAIVAAPTTSLPETIGGSRNWDYRYCWLRDASLTLRALNELGCAIEAEAFLSWMLHATRLTQPRLQILYDVYGGTYLPERELTHLDGYRESRPVRTGNDATGQLQLDVYGEVIDAAARFVGHGGSLDRQSRRMLIGFGKTVCDLWRWEDEGIWEPRSGRRHNTHSKVMCWLALDRLVKLHEDGILSAPAARFARERDAIREAIERQGWNEEVGAYTAAFGDPSLDASVLRLGFCGYADPAGERMRSTRRRIDARLGHGALLRRYDGADGLPGREGAFAICSFWGVEAAALEGSLDEAHRRFESILRHANDVGLFGEEIDPASGEVLGNFPQAFSHVGLINAALTLAPGAP